MQPLISVYLEPAFLVALREGRLLSISITVATIAILTPTLILTSPLGTIVAAATRQSRMRIIAAVTLRDLLFIIAAATRHDLQPNTTAAPSLRVRAGTLSNRELN